MTIHAAIGTIDAAQASQYCVDGFLVVRQVFSNEHIAQLDAEAIRLHRRKEFVPGGARFARPPSGCSVERRRCSAWYRPD